VQGLVEAGVVASQGGKVKLLGREELPDDWNPATDARLTEWEAVQHLIRALDRQGETGAGNWVVTTANGPGTWPTGSMPSASARGGRVRHWRTTAWSSPGRRSANWLGRERMIYQYRKNYFKEGYTSCR